MMLFWKGLDKVLNSRSSKTETQLIPIRCSMLPLSSLTSTTPFSACHTAQDWVELHATEGLRSFCPNGLLYCFLWLDDVRSERCRPALLQRSKLRIQLLAADLLLAWCTMRLCFLSAPSEDGAGHADERSLRQWFRVEATAHFCVEALLLYKMPPMAEEDEHVRA